MAACRLDNKQQAAIICLPASRHEKSGPGNPNRLSCNSK